MWQFLKELVRNFITVLAGICSLLLLVMAIFLTFLSKGVSPDIAIASTIIITILALLIIFTVLTLHK